MARRPGTRRRNPPATRSVDSAPRVSTPCRSRNASARACARGSASGSRSGATAHRPAHRRRTRPARHRRPPGPQLGVAAPRGAAPGPVRSPRPPPRRARSGASVSLVSRPAQTRSQIAALTASSPGAGSPSSRSTRPARSASSRKNRAPPRPAHPVAVAARRNAGDPSVRARRARPGAAAWRLGLRLGKQQVRDVRGRQRSQPSTPASAPQPVQVTSPAAVSSSSSAGVYPGSRAGRISDSSALAGSGAPASCSTTPSTSSAPGARRIRPPSARRQRDRHALPGPAGTGPARAARPARPRPAAAPATPAAAGAAPRRRSTRRRLAAAAPARRPAAARRGPAARRRPAGPARPPPPRPRARTAPRLRRRERPVRAGVAQQQVAQRIRHRFGERLRHPDGQRRPERVAHAARVLDRQPPLLAGDPHPDGPPRRLQLRQPLRPRRAPPASAVVRWPRKRSRSAAPSASRACRSGASRCSDASTSASDLRVEQLADGLRAEQLGEQRRVQRQRRRPRSASGASVS